MSTLGPPGERRRVVDRVWPYRTLYTAKRESNFTSILKAAASQHAKLIETMHLLPLHEEDRERGSANASVTYQDDGQLEERNRCPLCVLSGGL